MPQTASQRLAASAGEWRAAVAYALGLRGFLRRRLTAEESRALMEQERVAAADSFLNTVGRAVFSSPRSPYRPLFQRAKLDHSDLTEMTRRDGVAATLDRLYEAGVRISLAEFKGRVPIIRDGLELAVTPEDFDGPRSGAGFTGTTGGSAGPARRLSIDLAGLEQEGAYYRLILAAHAAEGLPTALWRPVPPGVTGIKAILRSARADCPVDRWFTPSHFVGGTGGMRGRAVVLITLGTARLAGLPAPWPHYVSPADPAPIVRWLAAALAASRGAVVHGTPSSAARICAEAERTGISLAGTFFRLGGEPFTCARHEQLQRSGARAGAVYSMTEVGNIGLPCADSGAGAVDDVHVLEGKLVVRPRPHRLPSGDSVNALHLTTLTAATSKFMLNVESGDAATVTRRQCGCLFGRLGYAQHLSDIHSYEKLTIEGMNVLGADVLRLVEEVLPARFGGRSTDYQLVQVTDREGQHLEITISPSRGHLDESALVECVLGALASQGRAEEMASEIWRTTRRVTINRAEPRVTAMGKTPAVITAEARPD